MQSTALPPHAAPHWSKRLRSQVRDSGGEPWRGNQRDSVRKPTSIAGFITADGMMRALGCRVVDVSSSGARIQLLATAVEATAWDIPDEFRLLIGQGVRQAEVGCRVVRRHGIELGVRLAGEPRIVGQPPVSLPR